MDTKKDFFLKLENYIIQNKIPVWQFGVQNAYLVVYVGILHNNIFSLLTSYIFEKDLCLHKFMYEVDAESNILNLDNNSLENYKFFNSGLTKKDYYLKYIANFSNYDKFLESALIFYLKFSIKNNKLPQFMYLFSQILIANKRYTSMLYNDIKNINIFSTFALQCLTGFFYNFTDSQIINRLSFSNKNEFLTTEKNHVVFRFINGFSFYFSSEFRSICFTDCIKMNTYVPMFLALKIYKVSLLFPKLTLNELKKIKCISDFTKNIINKNIMNNQTINLLIEKNWRYYEQKQQ